MDSPERYTIDDLVELTGFSRRTIRFYVERGLLEPPAGRGRGGFYDASQLARLREIAAGREEGRSLASIATRRDEAGPLPPAVPGPAPARRLRWELAPGLFLEVEEASLAARSGLVSRILALAGLAGGNESKGERDA